MVCDICQLPIEPGQPRFGCPGSGDKTGPWLGQQRHYNCHTEKYGRPDSRLSSEIFADMRQAIGQAVGAVVPERKALKAPLVTKGEINRSDNAARPFQLYSFISQMGKRRASCDCPFCNTTFTVYVWSLSGGGKKCPGCGAMFGSYGLAHPLVGNEDL